MEDIADIFGRAGPLARSLPGYKPRRAQIEMARRVMQALAGAELLIVEAGTGTGKTFAYLVPALLAGKRMLISTGTRTLQDQLFGKDLPLLAAAIGRPARVALLKGRSNYLCKYRLQGAMQQLSLDGIGAQPTADTAMLARIDKWAATTLSGDLAELPGLADTTRVAALVTSTRENCLGQRCAEYSRCHVVEARRRAQEADIVIVNHHLLLADLALKEDGFGDLLGAADAVILDEAHQIPDLATEFFGDEVSSRQFEQLLGDVRRELAAAGQSAAPIAAPARALEQALNATLAVLPRSAGRVPWAESGVDPESFALAIASAARLLAGAIGGTPHAAVALCAERALTLADTIERVALAPADAGARTLEAAARGFSFGLLPFDVAERFRALTQQRRAAWIFTSATLSVGGDFTHFAARLGLQDAPTLSIPSPFDFENQALLFLPAQMPEPSDPGYVQAVVDAALPLIEASGGGAFVLFTSHRALARAAELVRAHWSRPGSQGFPLLVQGESPREQLLREFREHGNAVLLGTASFWEGVDVKGQALRLVVIEKLPFASPDDALVKARIEHLKATGGNPFRDFQLPEAALALKQGVGRLIRSEEDRGLVVICDPRIIGRSYGKVLRASLPPLPITRDVAEAKRFLRRASP